MSESRRTHPFKHVRFALAEYSDHLGVPLMIAAVLVVLVLVALVAFPVGSPKTIEGRVTGLGFVETDEGSFATASVSANGRIVRARLPVRHGCRVGDRIRLQRWPFNLGHRVRVANVRWPCSR